MKRGMIRGALRRLVIAWRAAWWERRGVYRRATAAQVPVSAMCDRAAVTSLAELAEMQTKFIEYVVMPLYEALAWRGRSAADGAAPRQASAASAARAAGFPRSLVSPKVRHSRIDPLLGSERKVS